MHPKITTAAVSALLLLTACENARPELFIEDMIAPDKSCVYNKDSEEYILKGVYDISCDHPYSVVARIIGLIHGRADTARQRTEPNVLQFSSAEVQLTTLKGEAVGKKFSTVIAGTLYPGDIDNPGTTMAYIEIVPKSLIGWNTNEKKRSGVAKHVDETILATITLFGTTTGGTDIESNEFTFPFYVCEGCLTIVTSQDDCTLSDNQAADFANLTTCQNGTGYDGSFCIYCQKTSNVVPSP